MRRFLITSPGFTGEAEAVFDTTGRLIKFDVSKTDMASIQVNTFKNILPATVDNLSTAFNNTKAIIVEADFEISLEDFKREYPYSRNYHLLEGLWSKMKKTDQVLAYYAAIEYRKYCSRNNIKPPYIKIAATWLGKQEYYNDWKKM